MTIALREENFEEKPLDDTSSQQTNDHVPPKPSFKIGLHKGSKLTESIKTDLKNKHGCRLDLLIHNGYICPLDSKKDVEILLEEHNLKAKLIDVLDYFPQIDKKINGFENQIAFLQKKIKNDESRFLIDLLKYDSKRSPYDFDEPLNPENFPKDESEERKCHRLTIEKDFYERRKKIKEDNQELENLYNSKKNREEELEKIKSEKSKRKIQIRSGQNDLPVIQIIPGQLHVTTSEAETILCKNNIGIFQRSGKLVRIITELHKPRKNKLLDRDGKELIKRSSDSLLIAEVDPIYLTECLGKYANWTKFDERIKDWVIKDCPERIAKTLIARKEWDIPVLSGIIQAPTLRSNGSILDQPGYDENTGLFFNAGNTLFPSIPAYPSRDDALSSLNVLLDLLRYFPFENDESKSVSISAILTGLVRKSIRTAPLHGFTAPKMGSGKSLLADVCGLIATGKSNSAVPQAENEAEEKKRLLAVLNEGDPIICYDNIERPFESAALCSVLTQDEYKDRLLGSSSSLTVPTNATFLATGNNLTFLGDISTRAILCRLDPRCERPEERSFDIDLRQYIPQHRGELVKACLTMLRAYHVAGRPKVGISEFGRFEDWSNWVRSSLVWLGMQDPCMSRKEIENEDPERTALKCLFSSWYAVYGDISKKIKDVVQDINENKEAKFDLLFEALSEFGSNKEGGLNTRKLGKKFSSFKGRIENGYRIEKSGVYQGVDTWRVMRIC